jgi:type VI protein secretion system component VasK
MRGIITLTAISLLLLSSCKSDKKEEAQNKNNKDEDKIITEEKIKVIPLPKDSSIIFDEKILTIIDTVPEDDFRRAYRKFMDKDFKKAAKEMRKGADYLKSQSDEAKDESKEQMDAAFKELERISTKLEKGEAVTEKEILKAFNKAQASLANHYYENAIYAYEKDNNKKSGQWLHSASQSLQKSFHWTKEKTSEEYLKLVKEANMLSDKLKEEGRKQSEELRQQLQSFKDRFKSAGESDKK